MDWNTGIEKNREALKRILAALVAMAGLVDGGAGTLPRHLHAVLKLLRRPKPPRGGWSLWPRVVWS